MKVLVRPRVILAAALVGAIGGGIIVASLQGIIVGLIIGAGLGSMEEWLL